MNKWFENEFENDLQLSVTTAVFALQGKFNISTSALLISFLSSLHFAFPFSYKLAFISH